MEMTVDTAALQAALRILPDKVKIKVGTAAMRAGANVVRDAAVKNIQEAESSQASHTLEKSIQSVKFKDVNGRLRYAVRIKPKAVNIVKKDKKGNPVRVGLYGSVLNWGKKNQKPWNWITRAAREHVSAVLSAAESVFRKKLDSAVNEARGN